MGRKDIYAICGTSFRARRWLTLDIGGMICVTFSFSIHAFALYVISTRLVQDSLVSLVIFSCMYCPAAAMALISLFVAWTTDPGAVPYGARPLESSAVTTDEPCQLEEGRTNTLAVSTTRRGIRRCRKCDDNYKPPRAHHDSVTGRCIVKLDHFCPWVGNTVGAKNHKFFFLFIFYTLMTSMLSLVLMGIRSVRCGYLTKKEGQEEGDGSDDDMDYKYPYCELLYSQVTAALLIVSVMFLIFTCIMITEQIEAITTNSSKIARMKIRAGRGDVSELQPVHEGRFNEMFGGDSPNMSLHWFLPWQKVEYPDGLHDAVMGYEFDPSWGNAPYREPEEDEFESEPSKEGRRERESKTMLRAGGATATNPPLVLKQQMSSTSEASAAEAGHSGVVTTEEVNTSSTCNGNISASMHSTASTSSTTGTRKLSSSRTRAQQHGNGKVDATAPEIV